MSIIDFKFELFQEVLTPFGKGVINERCDDGQIKYFVVTKETEKWWYQEQLQSLKELNEVARKETLKNIKEFDDKY